MAGAPPDDAGPPLQQHQAAGQAGQQHDDSIGHGDRHALGGRQPGQRPDQGSGSLAHAPAGKRQWNQHGQQHRGYQRQQGAQRQLDADRPSGADEHQGVAHHHQQRPAELLRPHRGGQQAAPQVAAKARQRRRRSPDQPPDHRHQQQHGRDPGRQPARGGHAPDGTRHQLMPERRGGEHRQGQQRHGQLARGALDDHRPPGATATTAHPGVAPGPGGVAGHPARQHLIEEQRQVVLVKGPTEAQRQPQQAGGQPPAPGAEEEGRQGQRQGQQGPARREPLHLGEDRPRLQPPGEPDQQRQPGQRAQRSADCWSGRRHAQVPPAGRASRSR